MFIKRCRFCLISEHTHTVRLVRTWHIFGWFEENQFVLLAEVPLFLCGADIAAVLVDCLLGKLEDLIKTVVVEKDQKSQAQLAREQALHNKMNRLGLKSR